MQDDAGEWVRVPHSPNKPRSMSEGGESAPLKSIQQQNRTQRAHSMQQQYHAAPQNQHFSPQGKKQQRKTIASAAMQMLKNDEQIYHAINEQVQALTAQLSAKGIDENNRKSLKKELIRLKLEINAYEERMVRDFLKRNICEASRNRLIATSNTLFAQQEMLEMERRLTTEQFDSYVQSILRAQHAEKRKEIKSGEELLETRRVRGRSEDFLIAENKVLRAQNEMLTINEIFVTGEFNEYVRALLRTQYEKKSAEVKSLDIQAKELEIIEVSEVLDNKELDTTKRKELEIKLLTLNRHTKESELSKIEEGVKLTSLSPSDLECVPLEADILRKQIEIIEKELHLKEQNVPPSKDGSCVLELAQLKKEVEFLEKRKQYIQIKWQLKNEELINGERVRLEMNFAFLQVELLMHQKGAEESQGLLGILNFHKRTYKEMERIERIFRKDQEMSRLSDRSKVGVYPLQNYTKYELSKKYQELYNKIRQNTIERFIDKEKMINELVERVNERGDATAPLLLSDGQQCLFGIKEIIDQYAFDQFLEREQMPSETMKEMKTEYWGAKER